MKDFVKMLAGPAMIACGLTNVSAQTASERPNIVFILADDLGYGDVGCYGQQKFETPNIDLLARRGMRFTQSYSGTTVSAPSRSCLLTGEHSGHTAIRGNKEVKPEGQYPLPEGAAGLFLALKEQGYNTGAFGKWGLGGIGTSGDPNAQGVDRFFGYNCQLLAHSYYPDHLWSDSVRVELTDNNDSIPYGEGTYSLDLIHAEAIKWLSDQTTDTPFMFFYPTPLPHAELIVPEDSIIEKYRGKFPENPHNGAKPGSKYFRKGGYISQEYPHATFAAMIERLDWYVGDIINTLKANGLDENTVIIFASDNGPHQEGGADPDFFDSNGIYRGYKRDLYEGGIRVPMIVSWPGKVEAGSETSQITAFWDFPATFADLAGAKFDGGDGISFLPTLMGKEEAQKQHDYLYFTFMERDGSQAVRKGPWKLIELKLRSDNPVFELYNVEEDPSETTNVAAENPQIVEELKQLMSEAYETNPVWQLFGDR